jgi:uncharacterized membrane protein
MKFKLLIPILALAALCMGVPGEQARAQSAPANDKIDFKYIPPRSQKYNATMERLKQFRFLEQLSEFLSPLRLPHNFSMVTMECGFVNAQYVPWRRRIELCYEYVEAVERVAPKAGEPSDFPYEEVVVGGLVGVILHELGHAVFDMLEVPVMGREEDAADQMSTFIALQFSKDVARTIIRGNAYVYKVWYDFGAPAFFDEHGTGLQRYYNSLCIGYGADPELLKDLLTKDPLPPDRQKNCPTEYAQVQRAFEMSVLPFVDRDKMKKVQNTQWLKFTSQQIALLKQQQSQQRQTFTLALCNRSKAKNVRVAILYRPPDTPAKWEVKGWFALPDGACNVIGSMYGDRLYYYAEGDGGKSVWSAPEDDKRASRQCIDRNDGFTIAAGASCEGTQVLAGFRRWDIDPSASMVTYSLWGGN